VSVDGTDAGRSYRTLAFTLVEVMVAVALLGLTLVPLLTTHGGFLRAFARSKEKTYETLGAASGLALVEAIGLPDAQGSYAGEVEGEPRLRWEAAVEGEEADIAVTAKARSAPGSDLEDGGEKKNAVEFGTVILNPIYPPPVEEYAGE